MEQQRQRAEGAQRPTMRHVAALAGVGVKTVSRVINGEPNVSEATAARVRDAVARLNYQPDVNAGNLKRANGRTQTIGLLVGNVANPFSGAIHKAVEETAWAHGVAVFAASLDDDPEKEEAIVRAFLQRRVDGLILTTITPSQSYLLPEIGRGTPVVFVDREAVGIAVDNVVSENRSGTAAAAQHLIDSGHRRIAYLGDRLELQTARERRAGFFDATSAAGLPEDGITALSALGSIEEAQAAVTRLLDSGDPPSAILAGQNLNTIGAVRALHARGLQHEIALVGFDDFVLADLLHPGITVMAQDPTRIGSLAAQRLFARLEGHDGAPETIHLPTRLIERGSGEIPPRGAAA